MAGKIIGLGLLGLVQLLLIAVLGLAMASVAGALEVTSDVVVAAALAVAWFVVGFAFYASAFACAGALVPRQEELQSVLTPLTMLIFVSFFLSFAVLQDPDGTLATVVSFLPPAAPMTMPPRIALGAATPVEIVAAFGLTLAAAAALVPIAGRIYSGAVLRTGAAVKLRDAWRAARA
jgi:ABC-2 type transport system permease protein